jgi:hypothetical protein
VLNCHPAMDGSCLWKGRLGEKRDNPRRFVCYPALIHRSYLAGRGLCRLAGLGPAHANPKVGHSGKPESTIGLHGAASWKPNRHRAQESEIRHKQREKHGAEHIGREPRATQYCEISYIKKTGFSTSTFWPRCRHGCATLVCYSELSNRGRGSRIGAESRKGEGK